MATEQARITNDRHTTAGQGRSPAPSSARERLLAGLPVTERRLSLNSVPTAVLEGGDGPPIVLLHGPGEYAAKWLRVIPDLVTRHRVIAPDLPGHGESEILDGSPLVERVVGWLDDLIECTCPMPPVLLGHGLGGAIAARFAVDQSDRLARLVLVDTLGLTKFEPTPAFGMALHAFLADPTEETHDRLWSQCAFDLSILRRRLGDQWESIKAYNLDRARAPGLLLAQGQLMEQFGIPPIPPALLAQIAARTTLIWGRHDRAIPLRVAQEASARLGWPLHVIDDAADDPPMDQPESFLHVLREVLNESVSH